MVSTRAILSTVGLTVCLIGSASTAANAETVSKTVKEWLSQMEASETPNTQTGVVSITNVRLDRTDAGLQVILDIPEGSSLQSSTREVGNSLIIEIPNAMLALNAGKEFRAEKPIAGITSITATQLDNNRVQIAIAGIKAAPIAQLIPSLTGLQLSLNPDDDAAEEEITVTGTGQRDPLKQRLESPKPIVVIDQADIERFNHGTLGDILKRLPGVTFSGPPDENRDLRLRGLPEGFTQILVDGQSLPDERNNRQVQTNRIPASLIERIEIIRSPTAVQNSQGIGGTVNVILKTPQQRVARISGGINKLETQGPFGDVDVLYGDRIGDFGFLLSAGVQSRGSFKFKDRRARTVQNVVTQTDIEDDIKAFQDITIAPRFEWNVSPKDTLRLEPFVLINREFRKVRRDITNFAFHSNNRLRQEQLQQRNSDEERNTTNWRIKGGWEHRFSTAASLQVGLLVQGLDNYFDKSEVVTTTDRNFANSPNAVGVLSPPRRSLNVENFEIKERETFPTLRFDWQLDPVHRVSLGGEASFRNREAAKTTQQINDPRDSYQLEETQINLYLQDEIRLGTAHTFTIGTRLETLNATSTSFAGTRKQQSNTVLNPSLHYRFQASPITVLRASVARTVARPAFNQLIPFVITRQGNISQPDELGNPDLLPQAAWGFDVGLEQQFGNGLGLLGINGFYRDIDNLIETEVFINPANRRFQQRPVNIGSARAYGVEFDVRSRMDMIGISGLTLIGNISLLGSEVEDRFTKRIRRFTDQPAYIYNVGFDYTIPTGWLSFGLNYNYRPEIKTSDVRGDVIQVTTSKPLQSLDAYITVNFTKNLALSLYGRNLIPIQEIRPRQFFNTSGVLQSTQSDDQRSERILGATLSWQF